MTDYLNLGIDLLLDDEGDLVIDPTGDLAVTPSGRVTLMQDAKNLLDTLPGDLFAHPEYGAGVLRLFGEDDRPDFEALVTRAITDALQYDLSVAPRINPDSIQVTSERDGQQVTFTVSFLPIGEDETSQINLVWNANLGEI